jgi:hypothetical protein
MPWVNYFFFENLLVKKRTTLKMAASETRDKCSNIDPFCSGLLQLFSKVEAILYLNGFFLMF